MKLMGGQNRAGQRAATQEHTALLVGGANSSTHTQHKVLATRGKLLYLCLMLRTTAVWCVLPCGMASIKRHTGWGVPYHHLSDTLTCRVSAT